MKEALFDTAEYLGSDLDAEMCGFLENLLPDGATLKKVFHVRPDAGADYKLGNLNLHYDDINEQSRVMIWAPFIDLQDT